jgi:hypothetical protein
MRKKHESYLRITGLSLQIQIPTHLNTEATTAKQNGCETQEQRLSEETNPPFTWKYQRKTYVLQKILKTLSLKYNYLKLVYGKSQHVALLQASILLLSNAKWLTRAAVSQR